MGHVTPPGGRQQGMHGGLPAEPRAADAFRLRLHWFGWDRHWRADAFDVPEWLGLNSARVLTPSQTVASMFRLLMLVDFLKQRSSRLT